MQATPNYIAVVLPLLFMALRIVPPILLLIFGIWLFRSVRALRNEVQEIKLTVEEALRERND